MSKRLQVLLDEKELVEVRRSARLQRMTVAEWVRQALRRARQEQPGYAAEKKLQVVRESMRHAYPAGDVDEMLNDIARGARDASAP